MTDLSKRMREVVEGLSEGETIPLDDVTTIIAEAADAIDRLREALGEEA
ncbi:MAG: hypothetical protein P1U65_07745 [Minwuia sp.]|nr:hypothetical protein [Minwuia sp.]